MRNKTYNKKKIFVVFSCAILVIVLLISRLVYLMVVDAPYYQKRAESLHEREREIKAERGEIIDAKGKVLATNKTVCTISVIHSQIKDAEKVIRILSDELGVEEKLVRKKVEKVSSMERIKTNVDKKTGDKIREYELSGVKVDEDFKRYYPFGDVASKVLGFTGGDNQGIIGLEVKYEEYLRGKNGRILTTTDARGMELEGIAEDRVEAIRGDTLHISLDYNIQKYAQQEAEKVMKEKQADKVSVLVMNVQNGEILSMVNVPEFNLNEPFTLPKNESVEISDENKQELLNKMWRNNCINDTYEPGSTFKIITSALCLEEGVVKEEDKFSCPGYRIVENRRIRCHKAGGHGAETFVQGVQNSCNPVFIDIGLKLGVDRFYEGFYKIGLMNRTGIDLPGEAGTIMHKKSNIGPVELATMSFGQSFQITPIQLATTVASIINGGKRVVPHFAVCVTDKSGKQVERFQYETKRNGISEETSEKMRGILESVVSKGSGKNAYIPGYKIGGKTATSQTLPRSANKYISSFVGFAPADHPKVLALVVIHNPKGVYYGGTIAAPVVKDLFSNILSYLGIEKNDKLEYTNEMKKQKR
ncbi:peptidoglycan D,D-transpeptidase FtsI family protein [Faecalimonas sp.]